MKLGDDEFQSNCLDWDNLEVEDKKPYWGNPIKRFAQRVNNEIKKILAGKEIEEPKENSNLANISLDGGYEIKTYLPRIRQDFLNQQALGDVFTSLKDLLNKWVYKHLNMRYILDDLGVSSIKSVKWDLTEALTTTGQILKDLIDYFNILEKDCDKLLKRYNSNKSIYEFIDPSDSKLIKEEVKELKYYKEYILSVKNDLNRLNILFEHFDFDQFLNYFFEISGISKEEFESKLITKDPDDFKFLVEKIYSSKEHEIIKLELVSLLIIARNIIFLYYPIFLTLYNQLKEDLDKENYPIVELNFYLLDLLKEWTNVSLENFWHSLELYWLFIEHLPNRKKLISFMLELEKELGIDGFLDFFIENENYNNNSGKNETLHKKIVLLYDKWLLSRFKEYLDLYPGNFKEYLDFVSNSVFKKHPGILEFVDFSQFDLYVDLVNRSGLSTLEKAFAIQYWFILYPSKGSDNFLLYDNEEIKILLFLYENTHLQVEDLKKINDKELLKVLKSRHNLPVEYLKRIINWEKIDDVVKDYEIDTYKKEVEEKLSLLLPFKLFDDGLKKSLDKIDKLYNNLNRDTIDKSKKQIDKLLYSHSSRIDTIKKILYYKKFNLNEIVEFATILWDKWTNKNGLKKIKNILNVISYLLENFEVSSVLFIQNLIADKHIFISWKFLEKDNYKIILKKLIENEDFVNEIIEKNKEAKWKIKQTALSDLFDYLEEISKWETIEDIIRNYFPDNLISEVKEFAKLNPDFFYKLITISKHLNLKQWDEDLIIEILVLEKEYFKRFYFLVKNLNILGISLVDKWNEILSFVKDWVFTEEKLKEIKPLIKHKLDEGIDPNFFYNVFVDYLYGKVDIDSFSIFLKDEDDSLDWTDLDWKELNLELIEKSNKGFKDFMNEIWINKLANYSWQDILSLLLSLGFKNKINNGKTLWKGDHVIVYKEVMGKTIYILVPSGHKEIAKGTFRNILLQLRKYYILKSLELEKTSKE